VTFWSIKFIRHLLRHKILFYILKIKFYDWWSTSIHTWQSCWVNFLSKCELTFLIIRHFISNIHAHTFYNLRTILLHIIDRQWLFLSRSLWTSDRSISRYTNMMQYTNTSSSLTRASRLHRAFSIFELWAYLTHKIYTSSSFWKNLTNWMLDSTLKTC
jgi:hypothetical protein